MRDTDIGLEWTTRFHGTFAEHLLILAYMYAYASYYICLCSPPILSRRSSVHREKQFALASNSTSRALEQETCLISSLLRSSDQKKGPTRTVGCNDQKLQLQTLERSLCGPLVVISASLETPADSHAVHPSRRSLCGGPLVVISASLETRLFYSSAT